MKIVINDIFCSSCSVSRRIDEFHDNLPFLDERMKLEKIGKLVANLHDKKRKCYTHQKLWISQSLSHGLVSKKVQRFIKFNQEAWLKP